MADCETKSSDRFLFRVNKTLYTSISVFAEYEHRSLNGEICSAVAKWLYERDMLTSIKDTLGAFAPKKTLQEITAASNEWQQSQESEHDSIKTNVRFTENMNNDLRAAWACQKLLFGHISFNAFIKQIVSWWVSYRFEIRALSQVGVTQNLPASSTPAQVPMYQITA